MFVCVYVNYVYYMGRGRGFIAKSVHTIRFIQSRLFLHSYFI